MWVPNPSPRLDKNLAFMAPGILSSIGVGGWKKGPEPFSDSNTTPDIFQHVNSQNRLPVPVLNFGGASALQCCTGSFYGNPPPKKIKVKTRWKVGSGVTGEIGQT